MYRAQFTDNLHSNWVNAVAAENIIPIDNEFERVSVEDHATTAEKNNRYGRVIVIHD